jgi:outer membrane lipoprotein-sorting protein
MKILQAIVSLVCFQLFPHSIFAQHETELVKNIKAKLDKVNNYQADGMMKIDVSFIKAPDSRVKIFYKKPDQFAIKKESGISILPKGGVHINLSSILTDENYIVVPAGETVLGNSKVKIIKLLPNDDNSNVVVTAIYIDPQNLLIKKSIVTTKENGTYEMEMEYGKYSDWGLPDKITFAFNIKDYKLPKGMTFEYENGDNKPKDNAAKNKKGKIEIAYSGYSINKGFSDSVFQ